MLKKAKIKFEFDTEYQEALLRYTAQDKHGASALELYEDSYFTLVEHQTLAYLLKRYYNLYKRTPADKGFLKEFIRSYRYKDKILKVLTEVDYSDLNKLITRVYTIPLKDPEHIQKSLGSFRAYVELKDVLENVDLKDYSQYEDFSSRVTKAIRKSSQAIVSDGINLLSEIHQRQVYRRVTGDLAPSPFRQWDHWTNSGEGYNKGSVITLIGPSKKFKTAILINIAKAYLKKRKKILYIDLENGAENLAVRLEQSVSKLTKREILQGTKDTGIRKLFRRYSRLGGEVHIKRMSAYTTTAETIRAYKKERFKEFGEDYDVLIVDYGALLGAISGVKDDFQRISDAYVDLKNLTEQEFDICFTANHVTREAAKHFPTAYEAKDIAKCIDIPRHIDGLFGLNQTPEEEAEGVLRIQIVEQRDGVQHGTAYFWFQVEKQYLKEFSKSEVLKYTQAMGDTGISEEEATAKKKNRDI